MAAYKYPREIEFVDALPHSGTGKIQWRILQDQERRKAATSAPLRRKQLIGRNHETSRVERSAGNDLVCTY